MCVDLDIPVLDLRDVLKENGIAIPWDSEHGCYCVRNSDKLFFHWEKEIAEPALQKCGYHVHGWHTGDGDDFGPLTRYAACVHKKTGKRVHIVYG